LLKPVVTFILIQQRNEMGYNIQVYVPVEETRSQQTLKTDGGTMPQLFLECKCSSCKPCECSRLHILLFWRFTQPLRWNNNLSLKKTTTISTPFSSINVWTSALSRFLQFLHHMHTIRIHAQFFAALCALEYYIGACEASFLSYFVGDYTTFSFLNT